MLGVLPGVIGSLQATEAIKLVLGIGEPLVGRLLLFDALDATFPEVELRRDPDCPVCGENPTITEYIDYVEFCAAGSRDEHRPHPPTLRERDGRRARGDRRGRHRARAARRPHGAVPGTALAVVEDGELAPFVNVYVEGEDVRTRDGLETEVATASTVILLPAMAGGRSSLPTPDGSVQELYGELWAGEDALEAEAEAEPRSARHGVALRALRGARASTRASWSSTSAARDARHTIRLVREHGLRALAVDPVPFHVEKARGATVARGRARAARSRSSEAGIERLPIETRERRLDLVPRRPRPRRPRGAASRNARAILRPGGRMLAYVTLRRPSCSSREEAEELVRSA